MGPIPFIGTVEGVPDIDVVMEGVVGVVGDKSRRGMRWLVFLVGLLIVDF